MLERLLRILREEEEERRHFSHIIIFGGREDLQAYVSRLLSLICNTSRFFSGVEIGQVLANVKQMYKLVEDHGASALIVTIPETSVQVRRPPSLFHQSFSHLFSPLPPFPLSLLFLFLSLAFLAPSALLFHTKGFLLAFSLSSPPPTPLTPASSQTTPHEQQRKQLNDKIK